MTSMNEANNKKHVPPVSILFPFGVFLTRIHLLLKSNQMNLGTPLGASTAETSRQGAEVTRSQGHGGSQHILPGHTR